MRILHVLFLVFTSVFAQAQGYYLEKFEPYDQSIPTPAEFLGYDIGDYHTRHDLIVAYLEKLAEVSDKAQLIEYGKSHELRRLVILQISTTDNLNNLESYRQKQLEIVDPNSNINMDDLDDQPIFVNLGYNVHGNEPSSSEAALLSAYVLVASQHPDIQTYRSESIVFVDPTINPDGRDRHTQWANSMRSSPLNSDPMDAEHNEMWPRGRTNHYWFDLNRDWLLAVHPESQGKLEWYHNWYPNVVTDFHEMGSNSSYFFEPMKDNASANPIMPVENYTTLNDAFAKYYQREMDRIGSLYFTKEVFDGTYPGYGSSYPDLQGGLGILFEQASSRGHVQKTAFGEITFPFTIRHQFLNSIATVEASVENKELLQGYQRDFFESAISNAKETGIKSYVFGDDYDAGRARSFIEMLLRHKIDVYELTKDVRVDGRTYKKGLAYTVPTEQPQYRMVQSMFETYDEYRDSVYYDASAWSLANAYNMNYAPSTSMISMGDKITTAALQPVDMTVPKSDYAYLISWNDYYAPAFLQHLQANGVNVMASQKPFSVPTNAGVKEFTYGSLVVPLQLQKKDSDEVHTIISAAADKFTIDVHSATTGYSKLGIDLGSRYIAPLEPVKAVMLIGQGTSSYEVGFVWHLLDQRVHLPITKLQTNQFGRADLSKYNTMVLVSGSYDLLDSSDVAVIKDWVAAGNTLITLGRGTQWAINKKLVNESLLPKKSNKDSTIVERHDYINAREINGKNAVGGAIFEINLDITHPVGYGYQERMLPIYRNNSVWLKPSENPYSNVAVYTEDPHIDGFITDDNLEHMKKTTSILSSRVGRGRAILFAEDPNFRGTWYGTNKMFLNAMFFGKLISVPSPGQQQGGHIH